jgi:anti-sigma B factor antagonist
MSQDLARKPRVVRAEEFDEQGAVVIVDGDLDIATAAQLESTVSEQIACGHRHLVIDLATATFFDSTAIRTLLVSIRPLADDPIAAVVIAGAKGITQRALTVSGIDQMFTMSDDCGTAIDTVRRSAEPLGDGWRSVRRRPDQSR